MDISKNPINRALAAFFLSTDPRDQKEWPNHPDSKVVTIGLKTYVHLKSDKSKEPVAVYRVRTDGVLKRLKQWPVETACFNAKVAGA